MGNLYRKVDEMTYDGLITDIKPDVLVGGGVIAHGEAKATFVRGTILEKDASGKLYILGTNAGGEVTEDFNGDGTATTFTLTATVKPLKITGVKVGTTAATISSYNAQTGVVTLSSAPAAGTKNVHVTYDKAGANEPFGILCDGIEVGTTTDEKVTVYTGGCFDLAKCTVKTGYTVTAADKDALRKNNIVFKSAQAK